MKHAQGSAISASIGQMTLGRSSLTPLLWKSVYKKTVLAVPRKPAVLPISLAPDYRWKIPLHCLIDP